MVKIEKESMLFKDEDIDTVWEKQCAPSGLVFLSHRTMVPIRSGVQSEPPDLRLKGDP